MATINKIPNCPPLRFPDFNDDWQETTLGEIAEINPATTKSIPQRFQYIDLESVEQGRIVKNNILTKDEAPSRAQRVLSNGDVIFQMVRPYQQNNLYFNLNSNMPVVASTGYAQLRGFQSGHFLYYAVHTPIFLGEVLNRCTGSNYPAINSTDLSAITLALPTLAEQKKIADFLSLIDERIQSCSETIAQRKSFRNGIIKSIVGNLKADRISIKECVICNTSSLSESKLDVTGIPVYGASGIVGYTSVVEADQCAILIIKDGSGVGRLKYIDSPHSFTGTLNSLKSKNSNVNLRYVYYCMSTLDLKKYSTGTGIPHIYFKDYGLENISLPTLEEQKKIADFLSLIDERIEVEEQLLQQYEKQKRYLLRQMFV